jgi:hypothetical protein
MRATLIALCVLGMCAVFADGTWAATVYKIDIDSQSLTGSDNSGPLSTEAGWTSLDATVPSENAEVFIDDVRFWVSSTDGSRIRMSDGSPNPNALTGDFVYDDGGGQAVILNFGGAGALQAGIWEVDVYIHDATSDPGTQIVAYRTNGAETIVSDSVTPDPVNPAITFRFESDGTSAYDVFARENSDANRSRLNAVQLTLIPEPSTIVLLVVGAAFAGVGLWRRRRG